MIDPQGLPVSLDVLSGLNDSSMTMDNKLIDLKETKRVIINKQKFIADEK